MILRLVYSFLFVNLITGTRGFEVTKPSAKTPVEQEVPCEKVCICQDQLDLKHNPYLSPFLPSHTQVRSGDSPPLDEIKGRYGYRTSGLPSANPAYTGYSTIRPAIGPTLYDLHVENENNYQVPRPIQIIEEEKQFKGKTICFTPKMVHRLVKAALEYVTHMPSDINRIIQLIDQDLDSMSDLSLEDLTGNQQRYTPDSKSLYKLHKPQHSGERTNVILQYEVPGAQDQPQCKEALERLIEIAYNAYLELIEHPQCKDYLYNYASHQPDDRPTGNAERAPGLKTLIISLLEQIDKKKPKSKITPEKDRYGDMKPGDEIPLHKIKIPKSHSKGPVHDYHIPTKEYIIPQNDLFPNNEYRIPTTEYLIPQKEYTQEYHIPSTEYHIPSTEYHVPSTEYLLPKKDYIPINEYSIPTTEYHMPKKEFIPINEYHIPTTEYHIPKKEFIPINEYHIPTTEYHIPKKEFIPINEYHIPTTEYHMPKKEFIPSKEYQIPVKEYRFPSKEYVPQVQRPVPQEITITESEEFDLPEIIQSPILNQPMRPEDITEYIIKILENDDNAPIRELIDNLKVITDVNQQNIRPYILRLLQMLMFVPKENNEIPRIIEILLYVLNSQRNKQLPWSDTITEQILSYVKPDQSGYLDARILDIVLNLIKMKPQEKQVEYILYLLQPYKDGYLDQILVDIIIRLIHAYQNHVLRPDYIDILLILLKKSKNGIDEPKAIDIVNHLDRWNEMGINPKQLELIFNTLTPYVNGQTDSKPLDIIHFMLNKSKNLSRPHIDFILSFLNPKRGLDLRRIEIIHFLLGIFHMYPKQVIILLELLMEDGPGVMNSRFIDILIFLENDGLLTPELINVIIKLLRNEVFGTLEETQLKSLLVLLKPYKQSNPKLVLDILTLLNQGGLHSNLLEWFKSPKPDFEVPMYQTPDINLGDLIEKVNDAKNKLDRPNLGNQYRIPGVAYESPDKDVATIIEWLHNQGLLNADHGANSELVNNIVKILELGDRELGVVELTYMLKHMKPLIYHPVYYVKYRLPIMSFITNLKNLLIENPHLAADPMKLLQELILISNVTEVSPNLQGYPKEEILKLTFNDGDLVQAKILDEQNLNLNDQITYVQNLNSDITPEDLLQLNEINEARYYPKVVQIEESLPEKIVINKVVVPPTHYRQFRSRPIITQHKRTIPNFIQRSNDNPVPPANTSTEANTNTDTSAHDKPAPPK